MAKTVVSGGIAHVKVVISVLKKIGKYIVCGNVSKTD